MATNFSPCKGSYVLNQFPSNVMFGMNGFHVSASGAIPGHHGPFVDGIKFCEQFLKRTSQGTFLPSLVQIGPVVWEEKMFKKIVDDARRTTDTSPP